MNQIMNQANHYTPTEDSGLIGGKGLTVHSGIEDGTELETSQTISDVKTSLV